MQLPSGLFCEELVGGQALPGSRSIRYTVMVYLGLLKAEAAGRGTGFDLERIRGALDDEVDAPHLRPGDLGLYLWTDARAGHGRAEELVARLEAALACSGGLESREGQELAWIVAGLSGAAASGCPRVQPLLSDALELMVESRAPSGLAYHFGAPVRRRRFANFATQIYGVQALAVAAKLGLHPRAAAAASATAEALVRLQLPDGGWPWLYDADRGRVVERYELYSVHQHAMAPMGLLELAEATGDDRYAGAALDGLRWLHGGNELGLDMVDRERAIVYRSLRRRRPWARLWLYANTGAAYAFGHAPASGAHRVELNPTCRPYELGWLLEAWCGREHLLEPPERARASSQGAGTSRSDGSAEPRRAGEAGPA
jgi:hypothetical protein